MKTIEKFYDKDGREVAPEVAVKCVRLKVNDEGRVVESRVFVRKDGE